jgi:hypothetical protein
LAAVFRAVNDWSGWRTDEERTAFLRPYLQRLGRLALADRHAPDAAYGYAAADVACRVIAPLALDAAGMPAAAAALRGLAPIADQASAAAAAAAVRAADDAAAAAADAAYAAYSAAAATYAAYSAAAAAYAGAAYRVAAGALLSRLLDVCEAGCWPLPVVGVTS